MSPASEHWVNMYPHIDAHLQYCRAAGYSADTTIPDRREVLERVIREVGNLHTATSTQLARWLAHEGWAPKTRATYHEHLNGYYRWALASGLIPADPMILVPRPHVPARRPKSVPDWVVGVVLTQAVEPWLTAAKLARYAGLRCCEIARARLDDITDGPPHGNIRVQGKGGRVDEIPTSPEIWSHVRTRPPGLLVRPARGLAYGPKHLSGAFAHYCHAQLGVSLALHDLRRHFGNSLRRAGVDLEVVRQLMRHESLVTTQRYLDVRDEERRTAILTLPIPTANPHQEAA